MQKKSVTLLISSLGGGGAERVCATIASALAQRGWDVTLLTLNDKKLTLASDLDEKVKLENLGVGQARNAIFPLAKYLKQYEVGRLVVFSYELTPIAAIARYFVRRKPTLIARNINSITQAIKNENSAWFKFIVMPLVSFFYSKADKIINQCQAMQNDLISYKPALKSKCTYIYNPVNEQLRLRGVSQLSHNIDRDNFILCVGRLAEQKAFHLAIEAFVNISEKHPEMRLKIIGTGHLESELRNLANRLGIENVVDFEGFRSDVADYYERAQLTLLSSVYEGFPNVLLESLALGTPVVSFDCPSGPREIINSTNAGELVLDRNVNELSNAIDIQLNKRVERSEVLKEIEPFTVSRSIQEWENILESLG